MNNDEENIVWFAMRAPFCKELEAKRLLDKQAIENFVPMCYKVFEKNNKKRKKSSGENASRSFLKARCTIFWAD